MRARSDDGFRPHPCEILDVAPTATREQVEKAYLQGVSRLRSAFLDLGGFEGLPRCTSETFDTYVAGCANRVALTSCRKVCDAPGRTFNPLYLHGRPGLGKSHLLSALCSRIFELHPSLLVVSTTAERFTEELLLAMGNHSLAHFQNKYRNVDVLVIDGFHMLGNRLRTQEELCSVLDPLIASARQIVIASQSPPSANGGLCDSLRSRLNSGLVVEIGYPELETRKTIVRRTAEQAGLGLSRETVVTLAQRIQHDVRALKGAVNRLTAQRLDSADEVDPRVPLGDLLYDIAPSARATVLPIDAVLDVVRNWYNLEPGELESRSSAKKVKKARQMAMYLARTVTSASLQETADALGATSNQVLYAVRAVEKSIADPVITADLDALHAALAAAPARATTGRARTGRRGAERGR